MPLVAARVAAAIAFCGITLLASGCSDDTRSIVLLGVMFAITGVFFFVTAGILDGHPGEVAAVLAAAYVGIPFVVLTGLAIFPLTVLESAVIATPLLGFYGLALALFYAPFDNVLPVPVTLSETERLWTSVGMVWPLLLVAGVAALAGLSQLQLLIAATEEALRDRLTGLYGRLIGEAFLDAQLQMAQRQKLSLSVAFVDLDDFKPVNDGFGHLAGDRLLKAVAASLRDGFRKQDMVVRWGGEEFLVIMPATKLDEAVATLERVMDQGLAVRPDGKRQTASVGVAQADLADSASDALSIADRAMYEAKRRGKNRIIGESSPVSQRREALRIVATGS
jgi:diguanylate cyclase (GGDEF)-like protein